MAEQFVIKQYNSKQMDRALRKLKERRKARQKARDEEKCYVEYRKQQVLSAFQPSVGALRSGDEAFPKRRRGSMGFGERKAHYLAIRPDPKFATWIGRKKGVYETKAQPRIATPSAAGFTDHSSVTDTPRMDSKRQLLSDKKEEQSHTKKDKENNQMCQDANVLTFSNHPSLIKDDKDSVKRGANNSDNPLINGVPFWTNQINGEADEITDEDLPVDMDILEKVCNGHMILAQKPFQKTNFNPYGPMQRFKFDDALFVRESTLFTSTVEAVISLQPDEDHQYATHPPISHIIKWHDKITMHYFDPSDREAGSEGPFIEDFKDIRREKTDKKAN